MPIPPLLTDAAPEFASALEAGLREDGEVSLADQVRLLRVVALCCDDGVCGSFSTVPPDDQATGDDFRTTLVEASTGNNMVILDTADGRIVYVEVIDDGQLRATLEEAGITF